MAKIEDIKIISQYKNSIGESFDPAFFDKQSEQRIHAYACKCQDYLRFGYEVDACLNGDFSAYSDVLVTENTPDIFLTCGFQDLPILHTQSHVRKELAPKDDFRHQHGLTVEQLKSLPELLEKPVMIFDTPFRRNRFNEIIGEGKGVVAILDCLDADNIPLTAYFSPNGHGQYESLNITSNFLTSIYGRTNLVGFVGRAFAEKKILYVDEEKFEYMKKDSLRFDEPQCSPAIENLYGIIKQSRNIVNSVTENIALSDFKSRVENARQTVTLKCLSLEKRQEEVKSESKYKESVMIPVDGRDSNEPAKPKSEDLRGD